MCQNIACKSSLFSRDENVRERCDLFSQNHNNIRYYNKFVDLRRRFWKRKTILKLRHHPRQRCKIIITNRCFFGNGMGIRLYTYRIYIVRHRLLAVQFTLAPEVKHSHQSTRAGLTHQSKSQFVLATFFTFYFPYFSTHMPISIVYPWWYPCKYKCSTWNIIAHFVTGEPSRDFERCGGVAATSLPSPRVGVVDPCCVYTYLPTYVVYMINNSVFAIPIRHPLTNL